MTILHRIRNMFGELPPRSIHPLVVEAREDGSNVLVIRTNDYMLFEVALKPYAYHTTIRPEGV